VRLPYMLLGLSDSGRMMLHARSWKRVVCGKRRDWLAAASHICCQKTSEIFHSFFPYMSWENQTNEIRYNLL